MTPADLYVVAACVEAAVKRGTISDEHGSELIESLKAMALAMFDVRTLDEWDPQWAMKDYGDKRSCYLPAGDKIFEGATSDEAPRQSRGMGHGAMSDDRRCMCCAGPLSSDAEAACGVCRLCQKDPEPGDFDNDPDGMLADGDPAEP